MAILQLVKQVATQLSSKLNLGTRPVQPTKNWTSFVRCLSTGGADRIVPIPVRAERHPDRVALVDQHGRHSYNDLLQRSRTLALQMQKLLPKSDEQQRIAFLCPHDVKYVVAQWATWLLGHVAVPLGKMHPTPQLEYYVKDSDCALLLTTNEFVDRVSPIISKNKLMVLNETNTGKGRGNNEPIKRSDSFYQKADAMFLYTSGTTGPPKGVVLTHGNLDAAMSCIVQAWDWTPDDKTLHVLPLHHVHGIIYLLMTPMYIGAKCVLHPKFDAVRVWQHLISPANEDERVNVFMGVPTVYVKLIEEYEKLYGKAGKKVQDEVRAKFKKNMRLVVSGSASLPEPVFERWCEISGMDILERYGMSEIGLALSNPIKGPCVKGCVGVPLPTVEVCIAKENPKSPVGYDVVASGNEKGTVVTKGLEEESGELYIKGPSVFKNYWNKAEATEKTFTKDGWFKTGDTVQYLADPGTYKILGRTSVDIIKSGGYKISALDIETTLLTHPDVLEVSVMGVEDKTWGQRVAAVIMQKPEVTKELTLEDLRTWCKERMPPYHVPTILKVVPEIPRNVLGKVNKKELVKQLFPS